MFDMNWCYNWLIVAPINCRADDSSNMYIPVSHTNGRSINNTISVLMNRLVGMGLRLFGSCLLIGRSIVNYFLMFLMGICK